MHWVPRPTAPIHQCTLHHCDAARAMMLKLTSSGSNSMYLLHTWTASCTHQVPACTVELAWMTLQWVGLAMQSAGLLKQNSYFTGLVNCSYSSANSTQESMTSLMNTIGAVCQLCALSHLEEAVWWGGSVVDWERSPPVYTEMGKKGH